MRKYIGIAILALCVISGLWAINNAVYHQAANEICVVQSPVDGTLTVSLAGDWRFTSQRPGWEEIVTGPAPRRVVLRGGPLGAWDSSLALFLRAARL